MKKIVLRDNEVEILQRLIAEALSNPEYNYEGLCTLYNCISGKKGGNMYGN